MDNDQFKFGMILKPESSYMGLMLDGLKQFYITVIKGFHPDRMCVMTLLFEGDEKDVTISEQKIYGIGKLFGGVPAGERNGERGYMLTFVIAYIRVSDIEKRPTFFIQLNIKCAYVQAENNFRILTFFC